jgi:hypothetical protein
MINTGFGVLTVVVVTRSVFWDMVDFQQTTWCYILEERTLQND